MVQEHHDTDDAEMARRRQGIKFGVGMSSSSFMCVWDLVGHSMGLGADN